MKKKTSFLLLFLSALLFFSLYIYTETNLVNLSGYFNYNISNFFEYIFWWSLTLFIFSLFALKLDTNQYKTWLKISILVSLVSILMSYSIGDGNGTIIDINGELFTWLSTIMYSLISIIYFITQFLKSKKQSTLVK